VYMAAMDSHGISRYVDSIFTISFPTNSKSRLCVNEISTKVIIPISDLFIPTNFKLCLYVYSRDEFEDSVNVL